MLDLVEGVSLMKSSLIVDRRHQKLKEVLSAQLKYEYHVGLHPFNETE